MTNILNTPGDAPDPCREAKARRILDCRHEWEPHSYSAPKGFVGLRCRVCWVVVIQGEVR